MAWRAPFGVPTALGLLLGARWDPQSAALAVLLGCLGVGMALACPRVRVPAHGGASVLPRDGLLQVAAILFLGFGAGALRQEPEPWLRGAPDLWLIGRVVEWVPADYGVRAVIRPYRLDGETVRGRGTLVVFGDWEMTPPSRWIALHGRVDPERGATNPGGWTRPGSLGRFHPDPTEPPRWGPGGVGTAESLRRTLRERAGTRLGGFAGRFAEALLLGRGDALLPAEREDFRHNGASHLVAVSGLHVGLVAMLCATVLASAGSAARHLGIPIATWLYVLLAGSAPSAMRAGAMIAAWHLGRWTGRNRPGWAWLTAVIPWLLMLDPALAERLGFRLSVVAVLGIFFGLDLLGPGRGRWRRVLALPTVSLGAQWGTLPLAVNAFGALSPLALFPNLVAVPLTGLFLPAALLGLVAGSPWTETARILAGAVGWILALGADRLPFHERLPAPNPLAVWAGLALMLGWFGLRPSTRARGRARGVAAVLALAVAAAVFVPRAASPGPWVMFLDVGQGDAAVLRLSDGSVWVVDTGDDRGGNAAKRAILPFLRSEGIRRVDGLILSHRHRDHVGALEALLSGVTVDRVFDAGYGSRRGTSGTVDRVLARANRIPCLVAAGDTLTLGRPVEGMGPPDSGRAHPRILVLHPAPGDPEALPPGGDLNEASVVVRVEDGPVSILFTGDGEDLAEAQCLENGLPLASTLLKVGHHGSAGSSGTDFLERVRPHWAIVSCGSGNRYGHPDPRTLDRLETLGIRVHRTDHGGGIRFRWNEAGLSAAESFPPRGLKQRFRRRAS